MKMFPAATSLEFFAIHLLGELMKTKIGFRFLLLINDRFRKLTLTVPFKSISAQSVENFFVTKWVMKYGHPRCSISDNGCKFTERFFQHVCRILEV